ncbi:murein biosynthesis integral membrane protein MurJ [Oleisolibacter albus]|uniref:murein biosynthesis integral membrane protein MurJ n=1 Tax=Oleisolibacter albus TaxID=2171757 RepID=UPI000DF137DF|nr:murein biosynthesis integral membrane protein MurJ [Oleisolibacter albus]
MSLARAIATVGGITMVSRVAGFIRDSLMARILGAGPEADAFFVAFRLPNLFRSLFAEGAFTAAFLPLFKGELHAHGHEGARRLAEEALSIMVTVLLGFSIVMSLAMPGVVAVLATGFTDTPDQFRLAVSLSQVTFSYLTLISLTALLGSILNALGRFGPFAAAPILLNLVQITGLLLCRPLGVPAHWMLAFGVPVAGLAQLVWMVLACRRAGMNLRLRRPRLTPKVKRLFALLAPGILGAGVYQFNLLIGTNLASWLPAGSVSWLQYADRLNQLPMSVIGVAVGTALLPLLSQKVLEGDRDGVREAMSRGLEFAMLLGLPAAAALLVIPGTIIDVVFQGGAFTAAAATGTASALQAYAIGIPAFIAAKVLSAAFFARQDTRAPVRVAVVVLLANIAVSLSLIGPLGHVGLALAPGLTAWLNVGLLAWGLHRRGQLDIDRRFWSRLWRILLAVAGMTAVAYGSAVALRPWFDSTRLPVEAAALLIVITLCMAVYGGLCLLTGAARPAEVKAILRRRAKTAPPLPD